MNTDASFLSAAAAVRRGYVNKTREENNVIIVYFMFFQRETQWQKGEMKTNESEKDKGFVYDTRDDRMGC